jgi:hypothetical protein
MSSEHFYELDFAPFAIIIMAYNRRNYLKNVRYIVAVYNRIKQHDIPDTHILRHEFPKHGIFISYRTWMNIKNLSSSEIQLALF